MTTLLASHRDGPTTSPVAKWSNIEQLSTLNVFCVIISTWLYNRRGVPNALYDFKSQIKWVVSPRHNQSTRTLPVAKWPKIKQLSTLNDCRVITTLLYNCRGVPNVFYAYKGQIKWVVGLRHNQSTRHHTPMAPQHLMWPNSQKNKQLGALNSCRGITTQPYNLRYVPNALYAFWGQNKWVVSLRHDYSASITL
jgi:hypothetical protein